MSRRIEGDDGKKSALNMRTTNALRSRIEDAAAKSGRSMAQEAEFRLERSFDPIAERLCEIAVDTNRKSARVIRALAAIFDRVDFEEQGAASYLARAGLVAAFQAIVEEHFPNPAGIMADIFHSEDPALRAKAEERFKLLAEQVLKNQRAALYGDKTESAGLTLLQSALVLGLLPSDGKEATRVLEEAATAARQKKSATAK